jgi:ABC-type Fe3+/spermidine/putrescine transport system ATPase subunit
MTKTILTLHQIRKDYEGKPLLYGIDLNLQADETLCLLGPSGSGKSTLLRIIAGLEQAEAGAIFWMGQDIGDVPVEKRNFGLMFQEYALFPHMNVAQNIAFGPSMKHWAQEQIEERVRETLKLVHLEGFAQRRVVDLSGGEKQRVALARAIAPKPELLMLDEPLGALDKALRDELGQELHAILKELQIPTIYVTHDQEEAFTMGDSVAVLNFGSILQRGTPEQIYHHPASLWLARFIGFSNQCEGYVENDKRASVSTAIGTFQLEQKEVPELSAGQQGTLVFKPVRVRIEREPQESNCFQAKVLDSHFRGEGYRLVVALKDGNVFTFLDEQKREIDSVVHIMISSQDLLWYPLED